MVKPAVLLAAPHRLLFLIGVVQLAAMMMWWLAVLSGLYFGTTAPAGGDSPQAPLHAPILVYLALPSLFFGFLLTVFPRWIGYPDLEHESFAPVAGGYGLATLLSWGALLSGNDRLLASAFASASLACLWGFSVLLSIALRERLDGKPPTWHGWSILAAFVFGLIGQIALMAFLLNPASPTLPLANGFGLWAFLLPVFVTVCHRMIPFFAGSVVAGYVRWRPFWALSAYWGGTVLLLAGQLFYVDQLRAVAAAILCVLTALMSWKWWPRAKAPALFWVLIIGFAWAPVGFALTALSSLGFPLGRAPEHALTIGFAGSLLIAMVTRVTQGHSGRPLELPQVAKIAFAGMQVTALVRIAAAMNEEAGAWLVLSATVFVIALLLWAARNALIYLAPRKDGKPG
ncbi:NnrS family protein [Sphingorhabdus lacus]|uniref:NnrS family protein n=1 Tax=Sphingorhabdus lacus TaxID=392610 RepID=UPI00131C16A4|nr:NnrS family protein [Sphingorhabdus lacus]